MYITKKEFEKFYQSVDVFVHNTTVLSKKENFICMRRFDDKIMIKTIYDKLSQNLNNEDQQLRILRYEHHYHHFPCFIWCTLNFMKPTVIDFWLLNTKWSNFQKSLDFPATKQIKHLSECLLTKRKKPENFYRKKNCLDLNQCTSIFWGKP